MKGLFEIRLRPLGLLMVAVGLFLFAGAIRVEAYTITVTVTETRYREECSHGGDSDDCFDVPYQVEIDKTYEVPDTKEPEELAAEIEDKLAEKGLEVEVEKAESLPGETEQKVDASFAELAEGESLDDALEGVSEDFVEEHEKKLAAVRNSTSSSDPVRLASGELYFPVEEYALNHPGGVISLERTYESGETTALSFGPHWTFSYDSRVLLGVTPDLDELVDYYANLLPTFQQRLQSATSDHEEAKSALNETVLPELNALLEEIDAAIESVEAAIADAPSEFTSELQSDLEQIEALRPEIAQLQSRAESALADIEEADPLLDTLQDDLEELLSRLEAAEERARYLQAARQRNQFVRGVDAAADATGNGTIVWIGMDGSPRVFDILAEPQFDNPPAGPNGLPIFYPEGSETEARSEATDAELSIRPDGSYEVERSDGVRYLYDGFGRLDRIIDRNGNETRFSYGPDGLLRQIRDSVGRTITISRDGTGRIQEISAPKGRSWEYAYDGNGLLSAVTDAGDDTVQYFYEEGRLVSVRKPDGSTLNYSYEMRNGQWHATRTADEEGHAERIRYMPGYTEYETASGIVERHHFDEQFRPTRIDYADGSHVEMFYDEEDNVIRRIDERGEEWRFDYDDAGNRTFARDPAGNVERWTYNEFS
ncbi:MAG: DUF6531 domain-containing protein, partial [Spirochaetia bacterium]